MKRTLPACLALACLVLTACVTPPDKVDRTYLCEGGRLATVNFSGATARVRVNNESFDVWLERSGSGARYAGSRAVLHTKDDEALLSIDGRELGPCQEVKPRP